MSRGVGRLKKEFHELLRQLDAGVHYQFLRFDRPVAALIPYLDYVAFTELAGPARRRSRLRSSISRRRWATRTTR
jgi:antitoxin (DNA-binding transcriptional repressor) of toxin-antitoxin stability system